MTKRTNAPAGNLASRAMLVKLVVTGWTGKLRDDAVACEVAAANGASEAAGTYTKNLLPKDALAEVQRLGTEARDAHYAVTMPWDDGAFRLLPVDLFDRYCQRMDDIRDRRLAAVQTLLAGYDRHVERACAMLGNLYNPDEYPRPEQLAERIGLDYEFMPVPDAKHFVADLPAAEAKRIRTSVQQQIEGRIHGTVLHLQQRLADVVSTLADRMGEDDDGKPRIFRDSLVQNVLDTVGLLPDLNLTGDAELAAMGERLAAAMQDVVADNLRPRSKDYDAAKHQRVKAVAEDLAGKFAGYFGDGK